MTPTKAIAAERIAELREDAELSIRKPHRFIVFGEVSIPGKELHALIDSYEREERYREAAPFVFDASKLSSEELAALKEACSRPATIVYEPASPTPVETEPRIGEQLAGYSIAELEAICAAATPGQWEVYAQTVRDPADAIAELAEQVHATDPFVGVVFLINADGKCPATTGCGPTSEANANFLVAAHAALPAALQRIKELEGHLDEWIMKSLTRQQERNEAEEALKRLREALNSAEGLRDAHFSEILRARRVIADLTAIRERVLTWRAGSNIINVILSEDARIEGGRLANQEYLAVKIAGVTEEAVRTLASALTETETKEPANG